jgi:hypothetical protein
MSNRLNARDRPVDPAEHEQFRDTARKVSVAVGGLGLDWRSDAAIDKDMA